MPGHDDFVRTIGAVHSAALDEALWPDALDSVRRLFGALGATYEVFEKRPMNLLELRIAGLPPHAETAYLDYYAQHNPRAAYAFRNLSKEILTDYELIDERGMDRSAYYAKYLDSLDLRYFMSGQITNTRDTQGIVSIQRTRRQGHVGKSDVELMRRLLPHFRQAYDVAARLKSADHAARSFERALDWLADGAVLIRAGGQVLYANEAMQRIARRDDGIAIARGRLDFATAENTSRFAVALANVLRMHAGEDQDSGFADFPIARGAGAPAYVVSIRPLTNGARLRRTNAHAAAIVFVHDPLDRNSSALLLLQEVFGLTKAEADVARALQSGISPIEYARRHALSVNTVYTHVRRIREKTRCKRQAELIRALNNLQVPLRDTRPTRD
ncbi:MAG TPA: helix-turn-helix transcriptional regulator [Xanthobacteraceae bacterium]